jgi:TonB-dependent SusC/RagA subfamily outer membrane receptor
MATVDRRTCGKGKWLGVLGTALISYTGTVTAQVSYTVPQDYPITRPSNQAVPTQGALQQLSQNTSKRVTLSVRDSSVGAVIRAIGKEVDRPVVFNGTDPRFQQRVTVRLVKATIEEAFTTVLKGTGLVATVASDGTTIVIQGEMPRNSAAQSATGVVTGRVIDSATQKGVAGVTVTVVGSNLSVATREDGGFKFDKVPTGEQSINARILGYQSKVVKVTVDSARPSKITIVLQQTVTTLSGVVTTAAGVQRRVEVGNDIIVLKADSIMRTASISTVTELLATRVPGLVVMPSSGQPGAPSRLRLRGTSSITRSNDPIVIIDGVRIFTDQFNNSSKIGNLQTSPINVSRVPDYAAPSPLDQIDPNSIETIEVFKGPSASALYGADAANGVIVITTKRRPTGSRTRWTVAVNNGWSSFPGRWPNNIFNFGHRPALGQPEICPITVTGCLTDSLVVFQALNDPRLTIIDRGSSQEGSLTVDGGLGTMGYSLTGSMSDEVGILRLSSFERDRFELLHGFEAPGWMRRPDRYRTWRGSGRFDMPIGEQGGTVSFTTRVTHSRQQQSSLQSALNDLQGRYIDTTSVGTIVLGINSYERVRLNATNFSNTISLNYPLRSWLPLNATAGVDFQQSDNTGVLPRGFVLNSDDSVGRYQTARGTAFGQMLNLGSVVQLPSKGVIPGVSTAMGLNFHRQTQTSLFGRADQLPLGVMEPTQMDCNKAAGGGDCQRQSRVSQTTYGWYLTPRFKINDRFFISPGIRLDGGTASGSNAGMTPFPKMDFSWVAVNQPEAPLFGFLSLLRPRIAFGIAGVQPQPGDQLRLYSLISENIPGSSTIEQLARLQSLGNTKLRPERSREFEGGFDADLWNQRLTFTVSGYHKIRYDAIARMQVAPSANPGINGGGPVDIKRNIGTIRNRGFDATVGARVIDRPLFSWAVNTNIYKNYNRVISVDSAVNEGGAHGVVAGYPLFGVWARPILGYVDANRNGRIDDISEVRIGDSAVFLGAQEPNFDLSVNTSMSFWNGRFSVYTTVNYQNGLTQVNEGGYTSGLYASWLNDPNIPLMRQAVLRSIRVTDYGITETVNTLRWTSLSLNAQVPPAVLRFLHVSSLEVALQGTNLALKTNYRGKDPNVNAISAGGNGVRDTGQLPQPRKWRLQFRIRNY